MGDDAKPTVSERRRSGAPASDTAIDDPVPAASPRYANRDEIARGGMGRVVEAADTLLGRVVAIKEALSTDPEALRRFARETKITARLEHPSIVPVYDAGHTAGGEPFYVMRKVSGRPLEQLVDAAQTLADRLALLPNVLATAQAVAHAHGRGILHRDLKPSNILVGDLGETVVIDWGLAKVIGEADPESEQLPATLDAGQSLRTRVGVVFGTPGFMAPEQVRGEEVDERADVYALGATLYFLLGRAIPHEAASGDDMMIAAANGPPRPLRELVAGVPPDLLTIVDKAIAFRAADRYADAGAVAEDLQRFLKGQLVASHQYSRGERLLRFVRRHRVAVATVTVAVAALAIGAVFSVRRIVAERDRADDQAHLAENRAHDAQVARQREAERADQLLLTQARMVVGTNPSEAVAMLEQFRQPRERWEKVWRHVRGIAARARATGVAWGYPGPERTITIELSPAGTHALASGLDGSLWVYDLEHHLAKQIAKFDGHRNATFATETLIYASRDTSLATVDFDRGVVAERTMPARIGRLMATATTAYFADGEGHMWHLDPATGVATKLAQDGSEIAVSPDQRWLAAAGTHGIALFDLTSPAPPRFIETAEVLRIAWGPDSLRLGAILGKVVRVYSMTGAPPSSATADEIPTQLALTEGATAIVSSTSSSLEWARPDGKFHQRASEAVDSSGFLQSIGSHHLTIASEHKLMIFGAGDRVAVPMPSEGLTRVAGRAGSDFLVGAAPRRLFVWDTRNLFRRHDVIEDVNTFGFVAPRQVMMMQHMRWHWLDFETRLGFALPDLDPLMLYSGEARGDDLVIIVPNHLTYLAHRTQATVDILPFKATNGDVRPDGSVALSLVTGEVIHYDPRTKQRETVVEHAGSVATFAENASWIAVQYDDGTVIRRDLRTGATASTKLAVPTGVDRTIRIDLDESGRVYAAADRAIAKWTADGTLTPAYITAPDTIKVLGFGDGKVAITTVDANFYVTDAEHPTALVAALPEGVSNISFAAGAGLAVYKTADFQTQVADLWSHEHWPLSSQLQSGMIGIAMISPDGAYVGALFDGRLSLWPLELPATAAATATWLDTLTNATMDAGMTLTWTNR